MRPLSRFWPWARREPSLGPEASQALAEIEDAAMTLWPRCYHCGSDTIALVNIEGQVTGWMGVAPETDGGSTA